MEVSDHLTCPLLNLYGGQEATIRTRHGTMDWFKIGKGVYQDCILSPCLFNLYAEYIMQNARLDEVQAGISIAGRNISKLRYAGITTLMIESKEELKRLLMKVKEESEKADLKLSIQKMKIMASGSITSWQIDGETMEPVTDWILACCSPWSRRVGPDWATEQHTPKIEFFSHLCIFYNIYKNLITNICSTLLNLK